MNKKRQIKEDERKMNSDIIVEGSEEMKKQGKKKGWRKCKYLKNKWMSKKIIGKLEIKRKYI